VQPVKRVEIVVDSLDLPSVLAKLDSLGVRDYTAIKGVHGHGARGDRGGDPFSGAFDNSYLLVACPPEEIDRIVEAIRPVLARRGGMCLVSDASWVKH
jgi:nitrogen regulatory protein PII